jgi:hypothetical protein
MCTVGQRPNDLLVLFAGDSAADEAGRLSGLKKLLTGRELGVALRERSLRGLRGMVQNSKSESEAKLKRDLK